MPFIHSLFKHSNNKPINILFCEKVELFALFCTAFAGWLVRMANENKGKQRGKPSIFKFTRWMEMAFWLTVGNCTEAELIY
jgi:hypothetical protein